MVPSSAAEARAKVHGIIFIVGVVWPPADARDALVNGGLPSHIKLNKDRHGGCTHRRRAKERVVCPTSVKAIGKDGLLHR